ncbi:MAG TPA: hypothetical protein P5058_02605, partial [Eubacteriales bacterium]|nr:hypothetical protein [Eubacteriales bacterium]
TEINVIPLKADLSGEYTFSLSAGDTVINGTLSENIFGNCLTSNIDLTAVKGSIGNITITRGEVSEIVTLENKLKDLLSWKDALNIAEKEFKDRIESEKTDGVLPREIYVKFVRDTKTQDSPYFWYVSFIGENNSFWALLLDPANGNVLTKK